MKNKYIILLSIITYAIIIAGFIYVRFKINSKYEVFYNIILIAFALTSGFILLFLLYNSFKK